MVDFTGLEQKIEGLFEKRVKNLLSRAFSSSYFFTLSEIAKYKPRADLTAWKQKKGYLPECVEIYYKGEYVCDVFSTMSKDEIVKKVWKTVSLKIEEKKKKDATHNSTAA